MKKSRDTILLYMPAGGEAGVIQAWFQGSATWKEFRGPAYSQWHPGDLPSDFEILHNSLLGQHATVLHQDSVLALIPEKHSDFAAVEQLMLAEKRLHFQAPADAVF